MSVILALEHTRASTIEGMHWNFFFLVFILCCIKMSMLYVNANYMQTDTDRSMEVLISNKFTLHF